jgi:hypothetical protein
MTKGKERREKNTPSRYKMLSAPHMVRSLYYHLPAYIEDKFAKGELKTVL